MKPKIVSVKSLQIRQLPPPSEKDFVFLEMHGQFGKGVETSVGRPVEAKIAVVQSIPLAERKGLLGWLKGIFGK